MSDLVVEEAELQVVPAGTLRWVLRAQAARTDQVLAAISEDYQREARAVAPPSPDQRLAQLVRRLFDGELLETGQARLRPGSMASRRALAGPASGPGVGHGPGGRKGVRRSATRCGDGRRELALRLDGLGVEEVSRGT